MLDYIMKISDPNVSEEHGMNMLSSFRDEMEEFLDNVTAGRA
jgi:hypothetical protein